MLGIAKPSMPVALSPRRLAAWAQFTLLFASLVLAQGEARAQPLYDSFTPPPDQSGFTNFASSRTPGHLGFDATLWADYGLHVVEGRDVRTRGMPLRHQIDGWAVLQMGLWSRGALALHAPVTLFQAGDVGLDRAGIGNLALDGRIRVFGEGTRTDGSANDGVGLSLRSVLHMPAINDQLYINSDRPRLELSATYDLSMFRIMMGGAFTYRVNQWTEATRRESTFSEELRFDGGIGIPFQLLALRYPGKVQESLLVEAGFGRFHRGPWDARHTPVEGRLSYRVVVSDFFVSGGVGAGFNAGVGNPDFRALIGLGYAMRKHDQDADGIPDRYDECVHVPEDRDGFQDQDGCADDDNDGDQIVDEDDRCPAEPAEWGRDDDEDGCTDP